MTEELSERTSLQESANPKMEETGLEVGVKEKPADELDE